MYSHLYLFLKDQSRKRIWDTYTSPPHLHCWKYQKYFHSNSSAWVCLQIDLKVPCNGINNPASYIHYVYLLSCPAQGKGRQCLMQILLKTLFTYSRSVNFEVYSQWFFLLGTDLFTRYCIFHIWQRYLKCLLSISFVSVSVSSCCFCQHADKKNNFRFIAKQKSLKQSL